MRNDDLLAAYSRIDRIVRVPTLLEVARQSTKELVWSRLLAYFLHPERGHRVSSIWASAILHLAGCRYQSEHVESAKLEVVTENGKLIDLIIVTSTYVIAIENKLYAGLYNDLDEYVAHCDRIAKTLGRTSVVLLLSLIRHAPSTTGRFRNILWSELQTEVKQRFSVLPSRPFDRQDFYCNEFLAMMENVMAQDKVNAEFVDFVVRHRTQLDNLFVDLEMLRDHLSSRSVAFEGAMKSFILSSKFKSWQYRERKNPFFATTAFDITSGNGVRLAIDVVFEPEGVKVQIFTREQGKLTRFLPALADAGISTTDDVDNRRLWEQFSRTDDMTVMATQVAALLGKIETIAVSG